MLSRDELKKFSIITLITSLVVFGIDYFFFHFVSSEGITKWHKEPGKPFVANWIGIFATLFLFASAISFILWLIKKDNKDR